MLQSWRPNKFIFVLLAYFLSGWHSQISMGFREVLRLLVLYTGTLLISDTAVLCVICLHKCIDIRWKEHLASVWKIANKEYVWLIPTTSNLVQICFTILVPSRICVMLTRLSNSFNMLLKFISASEADTMFRNFPCWLAVIVVKSVWQSVKSWKLTVQVNYWCLFSRFQYLVEVSVTALRNLQSKIDRDNKPALSLLGWTLLAKPNMIHQVWQVSYTLHSSISETVKIIWIFKWITGGIKLGLGLKEYGGKWGSLHCPVKALKAVDFYVKKSYGSWR